MSRRPEPTPRSKKAKSPAGPRSRDTHLPPVTILVPVHNGSATLGKCLDSIRNQTYPQSHMQVLCLNSLSTDDSFGVFAEMQSLPFGGTLNWVDLQEKGKLAALNVGAHLATGEIVLTVDCDTILHEEAVAHMVDGFVQEPALGAAAGNIQVLAPSNWRSRLSKPVWVDGDSNEMFSALLSDRQPQRIGGSIYALAGAFSAFRRDLLLRAVLPDPLAPADAGLARLHPTVPDGPGSFQIRCVGEALAYVAPERALAQLDLQRRSSIAAKRVFSCLAGGVLAGSGLLLGQPMLLLGAGGLGLLLLAIAVGFEVAVPLLVLVLPLAPKELGPAVLGGSLLLSVGRLLLLAVAAVWLARVILTGTSRRVATGLVVFLVGGAVLTLPSVLDSSYRMASLFSFVSMNIEYYALFWIVVSYASSMKRANFLIMAVVLSAVVAALAGLFEAGTGTRVFDLLGIPVDRLWGTDFQARLGQIRVSGLFQHSIMLGAVLAMSIPLAIHVFFTNGPLWRRAVGASAALVILACLALTISRGAWIAMAIGVVIQLALVVRSRPQFLLVPVTAALALVMLFVSVPSAADQVSSLMNGLFSRTSAEESQAVTYRLVLAGTAVQLASERPLSGYGLNTFKDLNLVASSGSIAQPLEAADNYFAMVLVESGFTGFLGIVLVLGAVVLLGWRAVRRSSGDERSLNAALFGGIIGFIFLNFTAGAYRVVQDGYFFWILVGLLLSPKGFVRPSLLKSAQMAVSRGLRAITYGSRVVTAPSDVHTG